jgi:hypothetical protein
MMIAARESFAAARQRLPYDAEVEYIESVTGAFLDLGFVSTDAISFELEITRPNNLVRFDMGAQTGWTSNTTRLLIQENTSTRWRYGGNAPDVNMGSSTGYVGRMIFNVVGARCDTVNLTTSQTHNFTSSGTIPFSTPVTFLVFAINTPNGPSQAAASNGVKLHKFKVSDSGISKDLIPVRFTNELGEREGAMYDRLGVGGMGPDGSPRTDGLYRNRGTGAFIVGPDK